MGNRVMYTGNQNIFRNQGTGLGGYKTKDPLATRGVRAEEEDKKEIWKIMNVLAVI